MLTKPQGTRPRTWIPRPWTWTPMPRPKFWP